ncbi:GIY-YIG nuclease family protein [Vibrio sp. S4M6]|uniref:GIY-YIG nuclease family protein n=1 Tax=Vibrio sinus TaxID=2946865 RepID=UPI002029CCF5|nr:GIY-YIG nuclease family protein [Vibrio sinus]MCL9779867.1 GIY-YIG nuclease family protein [Vibrio sinus]
MTDTNCWIIYLIRTKNDALYCGITTDLTRRVSQHKEGKGAKALRGKGPLALVWSYRSGSSRSHAQKIEYAIKKLTKKQKEHLINEPHLINELVSFLK